METTKCSICGTKIDYNFPVVAPPGVTASFSDSSLVVYCPNGHKNTIELNGDYKTDEEGNFKLLFNTFGKNTDQLDSILETAKSIDLTNEDQINTYLSSLKENYAEFDKIISEFGDKNGSKVLMFIITLLMSYITWVAFQTENKVDFKSNDDIENIE